MSYVIHDVDSDTVIGPFENIEDAQSFVAKVEEMSHFTMSALDMHEIVDPDDWMYDNMDNILMALV